MTDYSENVIIYFLALLNAIENKPVADIKEAARKFYERCGEFGIDYKNSDNKFSQDIADGFRAAIFKSTYIDTAMVRPEDLKDCMRQIFSDFGLSEGTYRLAINKALRDHDIAHSI